MEKSDLNGLSAILNTSGTLHGIEGPPDLQGGNWASYAEYERAWNEWWVRTHCWRATKKD